MNPGASFLNFGLLVRLSITAHVPRVACTIDFMETRRVVRLAAYALFPISSLFHASNLDFIPQ